MASEAEGLLRTLTVRQLAEETGIQVWRIHQLVAEGKGPPHFRVGRVFRFQVSAVMHWMEQQTNIQSESA